MSVEKIAWSESKDAELYREQMDVILEEMAEKFEKETETIGEGKAGVVRMAENHPTVCVKKIINTKISPNDLSREMEMMEMANDPKILQRAKVNHPIAPLPLCVARTERGEYLFMLYINGCTIREIMESNDPSVLPENFDFKKFFSELKNIVEALNENGLHHRDLHEGNIMIDADGRVFLIDYGDAKKAYLRSDDPYTEVRADKTIKYTSDETNLLTIRSNFGNFLKSKGFFNK